MNPEVTSKEAILTICRQIVSEKGLPSLSMRTVAKECGIALGTLYNYYSDKDALLIATIESVWKEILHRNMENASNLPFPDYVTALFLRIQDGAARYPGFLTDHSFSVANVKKGEAKGAMEQCFFHIKDALAAVLKADPKVDRTLFSDTLTESVFLDFVMENLLLQLEKGTTLPSTLEEVIRRLLYLQKI